MAKIYLDEDGEIWESEKFDECFECKHKNNYKKCFGCEVGEEFEENDIEGVDEMFKDQYDNRY